MPLRKSPPKGLKRSQSVQEDTGRRPTLPSMATMPAIQPELGPTTASDNRPTSPSSSMRGLHGSINSDALIEEPEQEARPFNALQGLCREHGEPYPQPAARTTGPRCQSVYDISHYYFEHETTRYNNARVQCYEIDHPTPPMSIHEGNVSAYDRSDWQPQIYDDEGPLTKLKRRVSIAGNRFGDNIRRRGGSLKRRMSNRLGLQQFPEEVVYVANPNPTPRFEDDASLDEGARGDVGSIVFNRVRYEY